MSASPYFKFPAKQDTVEDILKNETEKATLWIVYPFGHQMLHPTNIPIELDEAMEQARNYINQGALRVELQAKWENDTWIARFYDARFSQDETTQWLNLTKCGVSKDKATQEILRRRNG